jgi:hypothetical protein
MLDHIAGRTGRPSPFKRRLPASDGVAMLRFIVRAAILAVILGLLIPQTARADQLFSFGLGYFTVRGEDVRVDRDILLENRTFLTFDVRDFHGATLNGEWLLEFGEFFEGGVGIGYYRRTVPSFYTGWVDVDGTDIDQDLRLRIVPITATVRLLPLGRRGGFQPYVGGGLGILNWRYSETGEFIDFRNQSIFRDRFVDQGNSIGPVAMVGARLWPNRSLGFGGEIRYQGGRGELDPALFESDRLDLGGVSFQANLLFRF